MLELWDEWSLGWFAPVEVNCAVNKALSFCVTCLSFVFYSTALLSGSSPLVQPANSYILRGVLKEERKFMLHPFFQWDKMLSFHLRTTRTRNKKNPFSQGCRTPFSLPDSPNRVWKTKLDLPLWAERGEELGYEWYHTDCWTESLNLDVHAHSKQLGVKWANVCASQLQTAPRPREWKY